MASTRNQGRLFKLVGFKIVCIRSSLVLVLVLHPRDRLRGVEWGSEGTFTIIPGDADERCWGGVPMNPTPKNKCLNHLRVVPQLGLLIHVMLVIPESIILPLQERR